MIVEFLVALIGLGVAIDYSLLVVVRWREERAHGHDGRGRRRARDGDRRPRGRVQRHDRRDRPARDDRAAAAVPALDRLRRHADPADQRDRRGDAAAGRPRQGRRPARLAARPHRRQGEPLVDGVGAARRPPALDRGRRRPRSCSPRSCSRRPRCSPAPPNVNTLAKTGRAHAPAWSRSSAPGSAPARSSRSRCSRPAADRPRHVAAALARRAGRPRRGRRRPVRMARAGTAVVDAIPVADGSTSAGPRHDHERPHGRPRRRRRRPRRRDRRRERRLRLRDLRQLPADDRADRGADVPAAGAGVPLAAAAAQGGRPERDQRRRRVGRDHARLAGGPRLERAVGDRGDPLGHRLDPADGVRVPVRPVDGLRGVHPLPDARGVRPDRVDRRRGRARNRPHRAAGDERRADPVPRVRVDGLGSGDRREGVRHRAGRRDHARRDRDPGAARARRSCRCSGAGTGGCRRGRRGGCGSSRRSRLGGSRPIPLADPHEDGAIAAAGPRARSAGCRCRGRPRTGTGRYGQIPPCRRGSERSWSGTPRGPRTATGHSM